jgi:hypothetical protein
MERNDVIEILDAGNEGHSFLGPDSFCCSMVFTFIGHH